MNFKLFLENLEDEHDSISANIPLPGNINILVDLFKNHNAKLFVVGGIVRDYLFNKIHGLPFKPKDVDVVTNVPPDKITKILESPEAKKHGIKVFPKGEAFGVISAVFPDKEEIEIASARSEEYLNKDTRHPTVQFTTFKKDAERRDLYYNALFYDPVEKKILDYNIDSEGKGQGFKDIESKIPRVPGDPKKIFGDDRLRILRLFRFFSRYRTGEMKKHLTPDVVNAIEEFKHMPGISPERISQEFIAGLTKSINPIDYLRNLDEFGMFDYVLPKLNINRDFKAEKDPIISMAIMLLDNPGSKKTGISEKLKGLKYPLSFTEPIEFLINLYHWMKNIDFTQVKYMLGQRDNNLKYITPEQILKFGKITGLNSNILNHFLTYTGKVNANHPEVQGLKGKELGEKIKEIEGRDFRNSLI